jgi:hypothetical protein
MRWGKVSYGGALWICRRLGVEWNGDMGSSSLSCRCGVWRVDIGES